MKHTLHIDPTYASLPEDDDIEAEVSNAFFDHGSAQIDRIVWQHSPALVDRIPLPVLEVVVCLVILFLAAGVIAALGGIR